MSLCPQSLSPLSLADGRVHRRRRQGTEGALAPSKFGKKIFFRQISYKIRAFCKIFIHIFGQKCFALQSWLSSYIRTPMAESMILMLCPLPRKFFRFSISNSPILVQTGCFLCSSHKAGLNAILVRGRPKCQNLAVYMLSYGEVRHQYQSISQSEFLAWPKQQATATKTTRWGWLTVKQLWKVRPADRKCEINKCILVDVWV